MSAEEQLLRDARGDLPMARERLASGTELLGAEAAEPVDAPEVVR